MFAIDRIATRHLPGGDVFLRPFMRYIPRMMKRTIMLALTLLSIAVGNAAAQQSHRIALVIGNSQYASSPLINPTHDADLIAKTLTHLGFEVHLVKDGSQVQIKRAIQAFGADLEKGGPDAVGLFYYAGHGLQMNGRNYLIPVGAHIERDADVEIEAVSADWVLEEMRYARNRLNFIILDACRNNPFARSFRGGSNGLARMDAPAGVLIAYSTAPGEVAEDGAGVNSPYSEALAHAMLQSHDPAELMFKSARDEVRRTTADRQTPWESSSLTGENFYFLSSGNSAQAVENAPPPPRPVTPAAAPKIVRSSEPTPPPALVHPGSSKAALFMKDKTCAKDAGEWNIHSDAMKATADLNTDGSAEIQAYVHNVATPLHGIWECDGNSLDVTVSFDNGEQHKMRTDYSGKLIFGYDKAGVPTTYSR
jgi:hypothetical protein